MFNPQPKPKPKEKKKLTRWEFLTKYAKSSKRRKQESEYRQLRQEFLEGRNCKRCQDLDIITQATTIHHKKGRIGDLLNDKEFFIGLCMACHIWVERNPVDAKQQGYSLNRL